MKFTLTPQNNKQLANLCGEHDRNLKQIAKYFNVEIQNRGHDFQITGPRQNTQQAKTTITKLFTIKKHLTNQEINLTMLSTATKTKSPTKTTTIKTPKLTINPRTPNQTHYLERIKKYDINFGIGPAGTGKTFLAVACAVAALETENIHRIIITRPAVEAGERLGFLPGDISQKVDPYLRPIYDALYDMLGFEQTAKLIDNNIIEIAPLAFMRGRTLNDAVIILDEAQNTTIEQMKMFLTRLGFGSKAIITGDITQIDLPKSIQPGLKHAVNVLKDVKDIGTTYFQASDIVRHPLVQKIVTAYEKEI
ncbi:MAG: PhoH family protein [Gammaproteobacteria bacterium]|nr:PhoH family protein [Gammaproteobacteria bacterium]